MRREEKGKASFSPLDISKEGKRRDMMRHIAMSHMSHAMFAQRVFGLVHT